MSSTAPLAAESTSARMAAGVSDPLNGASTHAPPLKLPARRSMRMTGAATARLSLSRPTTSACSRPSRWPSDPSSSGNVFVLASRTSIS